MMADDPEKPATEAQLAAREERCRRWQQENRAAIDAHNKLIEKQGIWSAGKRRF